MSQHMEYGESRYLKESEWKLSFFVTGECVWYGAK